MKDKAFIDTNLLIYYVSNDISKKSLVKDIIIESNFKTVISSQVVNEFVAVTTKKGILSFDSASVYANEFMDIFEFAIISKETIKNSFEITKEYKYSTWDSLIAASALENNCSILYSEDMQHGQIIESSLRIVNPFEAQ